MALDGLFFTRPATELAAPMPGRLTTSLRYASRIVTPDADCPDGTVSCTSMLRTGVAATHGCTVQSAGQVSHVSPLSSTPFPQRVAGVAVAVTVGVGTPI